MVQFSCFMGAKRSMLDILPQLQWLNKCGGGFARLATQSLNIWENSKE
jgi:hypothetical protein